LTLPIRTGQQFLDSLDDDREVWIGGERVADIRQHDGFTGVLATIAAAYDLQHEDEHSETLTMISDDGERVGRAYQIPRGTEDLEARRRLVEIFSARTGGTLGRLPEYGAAFGIGMLQLHDRLAVSDERAAAMIADWFAASRDGDAFVTTSFVDPQVDRAKAAKDSGLLHVVESGEDGIVLRGCKAVATSGAACNEFVIMTAPRRFAGDNEVIYVTITADSPGLKFACRKPFTSGDNPFDHPLAARFEESDAWALFDDVFVPRERIFFTGNASTGLVAGAFNNILAWPWFHNLTRMAVKADLLAGVATLITEYLGTWQYPQVQEAVGETIEYAETLRAFLRTAEIDCLVGDSGIAMPNPQVMTIAKLFAVKNYGRQTAIVRELCGQGILMAPDAADLAGEIGPTLLKYYEGRDIDGTDRIRLFHLAWDLSTDSFGGRQSLFELFNAGGLTVSKLAAANQIPKDRYLAIAKDLAGIGTPVPAPQAS
jgi:4-hydroxyphenylacetate 3-monooxygenase